MIGFRLCAAKLTATSGSIIPIVGDDVNPVWNLTRYVLEPTLSAARSPSPNSCWAQWVKRLDFETTLKVSKLDKRGVRE